MYYRKWLLKISETIFLYFSLSHKNETDFKIQNFNYILKLVDLVYKSNFYKLKLIKNRWNEKKWKIIKVGKSEKEPRVFLKLNSKFQY